MKSAWEVFSSGVLNAVQFHRTVLFVMASRVTAMKTCQCFLLNGVIFLGSIVVYDHALLPTVFYLGEVIQAMNNQTTSKEDIHIWESGKFLYALAKRR